MGVWVYGCMGVWVHGCMGAWVHGCMGVWVHGCMGVGAWVYGYMGVWAYEGEWWVGTLPVCLETGNLALLISHFRIIISREVSTDTYIPRGYRSCQRIHASPVGIDRDLRSGHRLP